MTWEPRNKTDDDDAKLSDDEDDEKEPGDKEDDDIKKDDKDPDATSEYPQAGFLFYSSLLSFTVSSVLLYLPKAKRNKRQKLFKNDAAF